MANDRTIRGIRQAAELIGRADALLVTAGAGMGVDSGLATFRSKDGFWRSYPALKQRGLSVEQIAQPSWFGEDPATAWAFYGHRQRTYRETRPHDGFRLLLEWGRVMPGEYFVVTSNVDEQFQAAGYAAERMLELHGSLDVYQCTKPCGQVTWRDSSVELDIDLDSFKVRGELPRCPNCGGVARPNVLMFDDGAWVKRHRDSQRGHYQQWLSAVRGRRLVIIEIGSGPVIQTVRRIGEDLVAQGAGTLVRINPDASEADEGVIPVRMGALEALRRIEELVRPAIARRSVELRSPRPVSKGTARGPEQLPSPVPAADMEVVEFFPAPGSPVEVPAWARALPRHSDLRNTTFVDLVDGRVEPFNYLGISVEDERAVLGCWYARGLGLYPPLPSVGGHVAPGFLVTGRAIRLPGSAGTGQLGACVLHICDSDREYVVTIGVARRPLEAAYLWRMLFEESNTNLAPLDVPQVPWIALRLDKAASRYTAMLPVLLEIGRAMAWTWLRQQAWREQQGKDKDGSE